MATIAPPALVTGAARAPIPYGLFSAVPIRTGSADRLEAGVEFEVDPAGPVGGIGTVNGNWDPADVVGYPKELTRNSQGVSQASPFTVYGRFACAPFGIGDVEAQRRATLNLTTHEEARVE